MQIHHNGGLYDYFAFISYQHNDAQWADWLDTYLQTYRLPVYIKNEHPDVRTHLRPVFRDIYDLEVGDLDGKLKKALSSSCYLIVICSPNTVLSQWVNDEVQSFIDAGREDHIIPFIVDGVPYSQDAALECFPQALREYTQRTGVQIFGPNVHEINREYAAIKVIARMLTLKPNELWKRYLKLQEEEQLRLRREKQRLQRMESLYLSEKAMDEISKGNAALATLLSLRALPKKLGNENDRPYVPEAEAALRAASRLHTAAVEAVFPPMAQLLAADGTTVAGYSGREIRLYDVMTGGLQGRLKGHKKELLYVTFNHAGTLLASIDAEEVRIWDYASRTCIHSFPRYIELGVAVDENGEEYDVNDPEEAAGVVQAYWTEPGRLYIVKPVFEPEIYEVATGRLLKDVYGSLISRPGYTCNPQTHEFVHDGSVRRTLLGSRVWDVAEGKVLAELDDSFTADILHSVFSHNGRYLLTVHPYQIKVMDLETRIMVADSFVQDYGSYDTDPVPYEAGAFFSEDDRQVIFWDGEQMQLLDLPSGKARTLEIPAQEGPLHFAAVLSGSNELLLLRNGFICRLGLEEVRTPLPRHSNLAKIRRSPSGSCFYGLVCNAQETHVGLWQASSGKFWKSVCDTTNGIEALDMDEARSRLALAERHEIKVMDMVQGSVLATCSGHRAPVTDVAFSLDRQRLVSAGKDFTVRTWNPADGECLQTIGLNMKPLFAAFSPDGRELLVTCRKALKLFDAATGECRLEIPAQAVGKAGFSTDGKYIISQETYCMKVYDSRTGESLNTIIPSQDAPLKNYVLHPDGRHLVLLNEYHSYLAELLDERCMELEWKDRAEGQPAAGAFVFADAQAHVWALDLTDSGAVAGFTQTGEISRPDSYEDCPDFPETSGPDDPSGLIGFTPEGGLDFFAAPDWDSEWPPLPDGDSGGGSLPFAVAPSAVQLLGRKKKGLDLEYVLVPGIRSLSVLESVSRCCVARYDLPVESDFEKPAPPLDYYFAVDGKSVIYETPRFRYVQPFPGLQELMDRERRIFRRRRLTAAEKRILHIMD